MSISLNENQLLNTRHDDKDLVQLAGYHAYRSYKKGDEIEINGKVFLVEHVEYDPSTGLDALTVRNTTKYDEKGELSEERNLDGELIIVYVGSVPSQIRKDWIETNLNLIGDADPAQLQAAMSYFDEVEEIFGEVSSVTGNSLGGALANRVAVDNPQVNSVTLNPAMLPGGAFDAEKEYSNITNYHSQYDFLTHAQESLYYSHRIPGTSYEINHGVPVFSAFISNHQGYVGKDSDGNFTIEVGTDGEVGHGQIHVGADDHIVLGIWSGAPLHGESSVPLDLNVGDMRVLAEGINHQVLERFTLSSSYLEHAMDIVKDESEKFEERVSNLQQNLSDLLNEYIATPLSIGANGVGSAIKTVINGMIYLLDLAEEKLSFLNVILNSAPAEFIESLLSIDVSVETIIAPIRNVLVSMTDKVDQLTAGIDKVLTEDIPAVFEGGKDLFVDSVVGELEAHYSIIYQNQEAVITQIKDYGRQVNEVADVFDDLDQDLGLAIATQTIPSLDKQVVQEAPTFTIELSDYLENSLAIKDKQVLGGFQLLKNSANVLITPFLSSIQLLAVSIKTLIDVALFAVLAVETAIVYSPIGYITDLLTDYIERLRDAVKVVTDPLYSAQEVMDNLTSGLIRAELNIPELIDYFESYIDVAIFKPSKFQDVKSYNISSMAILSEMDLLFTDIVAQLGNNRSRAIEGTVQTAYNIFENIKRLIYDVEKGTV